MSRWQPDGRGPRSALDRGSVAPLVIGMMLCLMLLGAGVVAATSAMLGGQRLQHLCDGAAAAAAGSADLAVYADGGADTGIVLSPDAQQRAQVYAQLRRPDVQVAVGYQGGLVQATCRARVPVTFGALFGSPTLDRTVVANARPVGAPTG